MAGAMRPDVTLLEGTATNRDALPSWIVARLGASSPVSQRVLMLRM